MKKYTGYAFSGEQGNSPEVTNTLATPISPAKTPKIDVKMRSIDEEDKLLEEVEQINKD